MALITWAKASAQLSRTLPSLSCALTLRLRQILGISLRIIRFESTLVCAVTPAFFETKYPNNAAYSRRHNAVDWAYPPSTGYKHSQKRGISLASIPSAIRQAMRTPICRASRSFSWFNAPQIMILTSCRAALLCKVPCLSRMAINGSALTNEECALLVYPCPTLNLRFQCLGSRLFFKLICRGIV